MIGATRQRVALKINKFKIALLASGELETEKPCSPIKGSVRANVFRRVPERAVVGRVDLHGGIIAPAGERTGLGSGPRNHREFVLHAVAQFAAEPARNANGR